MKAMTCRHDSHLQYPWAVKGRWYPPNSAGKWEYCAAATEAQKALAEKLAQTGGAA